MLLTSFQYSEHKGKPSEWILERTDFWSINLIVGQNASGKSRTLNVIAGLAKVLSNRNLSFGNGYYKVVFETDKKKEIVFEINIANWEVKSEMLQINGETVLKRGSKKGTKRNEYLKGEKVEFQIPPNEIAVMRRDDIQYPYLEHLFKWSENVRHFRFNTELGKNTLAIQDSRLKATDPSFKETDKVIDIFNRGKKEFSQKFISNVIKDICDIGYDITDIKLGEMISVTIETNIADKVFGIVVQEKDRKGITDQNSMSMGMFRAIAIIIHFNYYELAKISGTVLIDDIGEGLDYERSTKLIKLLIDKSKKTNIQLFMTTNDRFVMNNTVLEYWHIVQRKGGKLKMLNHLTSKETFEDFKFTGLSNFDFFQSGFFREGFKKE